MGLSEKLSFEVLKLVKLYQDQNGIRHEDHHRYRQFCTRKLAKLYKVAGEIRIDIRQDQF
jgi:signal recognition particle subunit SRP68